FALDMNVIAPLLPPAAPDHDAAVTIRSAGLSEADIASRFSLARALRSAGVRIAFLADQAGSSAQVVASAAGYEVAARGRSRQRLSEVEDVVSAVAPSARD
ncbi:MAG: hypothetical protein ACREU7_13160, partial [Burkholderiales bacterium]